MEKTTYTFSSFLQDEMRKRDMNFREFAIYIGVTHGTISKHVAQKGGMPSEDLLVKLSDKTGVDLMTLFSLAYPDVALRNTLSPRALLLAQRFDALPQDVQDFILRAAGT